MDQARVWAIRAGSAGQADHIFLDQQQIALSCVEVGGDVSALPASRGAFKDAFNRGAGEDQASSAPALAGQVYRFMHEMRIGHRVLIRAKAIARCAGARSSGPTSTRRREAWSGAQTAALISPIGARCVGWGA